MNDVVAPPAIDAAPLLAEPQAVAVLPATQLATVLCVDDETNILSALKRTLRGGGLCVLTAISGEHALKMMSEMPVDLIISDMRMPGMDGAQLLEQVRERWPQTVRILLTGHADMPSTVAAINRGQIYRYLQKPWNEPELLASVHSGLERLSLQRERDRLEALTQTQNTELASLNNALETRVQERTAELQAARDQLQRHYLKSIKVFANLLELRSGQLAGHGRKVAELAREIARKMGLSETQVLQVFVAGLMHDIGLLGLDDALLAKPLSKFTAEERARYEEHPAKAEQLLMALDDMQPLLPLIKAHHERHDGKGFPARLAGDAIPLGARILAVADAFDDLQNGHLAVPVTREEARTLMKLGRGSQFDPEVLDVFLHLTEPERPKTATAGMALPTDALEPEMVLAADLVSAKGILMLTAGHRLTASLIRRIRDFELREGSKFEVQIRPRGV